MRSSSAGYTLLESLIALAISGLVVMIIAQVAATGGNSLKARDEPFWESELAHSVLLAYYVDPYSVALIENLAEGYAIELSDTPTQHLMAGDMTEEMEYRSIVVIVSKIDSGVKPAGLASVIARRK